LSKPRKSVESKCGKQYWLLISSRGYWAQLQKYGFWGFPNIRRLDKIKVGDYGVVYLTTDGGRYDSAIGGAIEFTGSPTKITSQNTIFDGLYPIRMSMKVRKILEPPTHFKPLVKHVSFISYFKNFGVNLQCQPIKSITYEDYQILVGGK
jgi:predicted RNA-binding protein